MLLTHKEIKRFFEIQVLNNKAHIVSLIIDVLQ